MFLLLVTRFDCSLHILRQAKYHAQKAIAINLIFTNIMCLCFYCQKVVFVAYKWSSQH